MRSKLITGGLVLAAVAVPTVASATAGSGVSGTILSTGSAPTRDPRRGRGCDDRDHPPHHDYAKAGTSRHPHTGA
jgi:hypothetical protein